MTDLDDVTTELRALRAMLGVVLERLDDADRRGDAADQRVARNRLWTLLLSLAVLGGSLSGAWFMKDSSEERGRICDAMRGGFAVYTDALVAANPSEGLSPEERRVRDRRERAFRQSVAAGLAGCP